MITCSKCGESGSGPFVKVIKGHSYLYVKHRIKGKEVWHYVGRKVEEIS